MPRPRIRSLRDRKNLVERRHFAKVLPPVAGFGEWFDALPVFAGVLTRNAIDGDQLSDRFFSLLIFMHIGLPLTMLGAMWAHVQRVSPARTSPPRALAWGSAAMLAALCLVKPVSLMPAADMGMLAAKIPLAQ